MLSQFSKHSMRDHRTHRIDKSRRVFITSAMLLSLGNTWPGVTAADGEETVVYKSPTCGCCQGWVDYLEDNGFHVLSHETDAMDQVKARLGLLDNRLKSCHTAVVDGYIVEGHVPVNDIRRLLSEKPAIKGITAPGMPMDSPGMNSIEPRGYDVLSFDETGRVKVFSRY